MRGSAGFPLLPLNPVISSGHTVMLPVTWTKTGNRNVRPMDGPCHETILQHKRSSRKKARTIPWPVQRGGNDRRILVTRRKGVEYARRLSY
jgi:hypothetical protein